MKPHLDRSADGSGCGLPWLCLCLLLLGLLLLSRPVSAQESARSQSNWYRVEILVFAQREADMGRGEDWPLLPKLRYHPRSRHLIDNIPAWMSAHRSLSFVPLEEQLPKPPTDPPLSAEELAEAEPPENWPWCPRVGPLPGFILDMPLSDATVHPLTNYEDLPEQQWPEGQDASAGQAPELAADTPPDEGTASGYRQRPQIQWEPPVDIDTPKAFVKLPAADLEFRRQARRLARAGNTDVLFHAAWLQPIPGQDEAIPTILDSAAPQGVHPKLQGHVRLYSSRYLHAECNLWLNTSGEYLDNDDWYMPRPPLAPRNEALSLSVPGFSLRANPHWLEPEKHLPAPFSRLRLAPFRLVLLKSFVGPTPYEAHFPLRPFVFATPAQGEPATPEHDADPALARWLQQPRYDYRHAVLLEQRRRMRSGELHYIDHPMFGIVLKVSRHKFKPYLEMDSP